MDDFRTAIGGISNETAKYFLRANDQVTPVYTKEIAAIPHASAVPARFFLLYCNLIRIKA